MLSWLLLKECCISGCCLADIGGAKNTVHNGKHSRTGIEQRRGVVRRNAADGSNRQS
jgi:hypothetical protein